MRSVLRSIALKFPPIRRLYDHMQLQSHRQRELEQQLSDRQAELAVARLHAAERERQLQQELADVVTARDQLAQEVASAAPHREAAVRHAEREEHLVNELALAAEERDVLELQLYLMRSDLQRAAVRNQELSSALHASETKADLASRDPATLPAELCATLADQIAHLSEEIARLSSITLPHQAAKPERESFLARVGSSEPA